MKSNHVHTLAVVSLAASREDRPVWFPHTLRLTLPQCAPSFHQPPNLPAMNTPTPAVARFTQQLLALLVFRTALHWSAVWLFAWGVMVLALRFAKLAAAEWLALGLLGLLPVIVAAFVRERRRQPTAQTVRALCDEKNQCGGLLMAAGETNISTWQMTKPITAPSLRWRSGRALGRFAAAAAFVAFTLLVPERYAVLNLKRPLALGQVVEELKAQIELLEQEKILPEQKSAEMKKELAKVNEMASGSDPAKTWEALDHLKNSASDLAKQAAEEAVAKTTKIAEAEAIAGALDNAKESGANAAALDKAMQGLAALMQSAKFEAGLLASTLPPELLEALKKDGANSEGLKELLKDLKLSKAKLSEALKRLENCKLVSRECLGKCDKAGECKNCNGLLAYLSENETENAEMLALLETFSNPGGGRGGPGAPMIVGDPTSEQELQFQPGALPTSLEGLKSAKLAGISRSAPEVTGTKETTTSGALAGANAGGGEAHMQTVLPRHKGAVQRFFKRDN